MTRHAILDHRSRPSRALLWCALVAVAIVFAAGFGTRAQHAEGAGPPNVVFILTDDQTLREMAVLPEVRSLLGDRGVSFSNAYVSYPLCCPSRVTALSGDYMHNHGVRGNGGPNGGAPKFEEREADALPVWLSSAGYYNVHIGKYLNLYALKEPPHVPAGWDEWYAKISETSAIRFHFNYSLFEQGPVGPPEQVFYGTDDTGAPAPPPAPLTTDYNTDVLRYKALEVLDRVGDPGPTGVPEPFYLSLWFGAPHYPFTPPARHLGLFAGSPQPRPPGFNEKDMSDKPSWLRKQVRKRIGPGFKRKIAIESRRRPEMLAAVDEAVAAVIERVDALDGSSDGELDNTYVVFSSDNGFFRGEHRIVSGKYLPYEPASHVPLFIRGPGIPEGEQSRELVWNGDLTQTFLDIAGDPDPSLDGRSLLAYAQDTELTSSRPLLFEGDTGPGRGVGAFPAALALAAKGVGNLDQEPLGARAAIPSNFAPAFRGIRSARYQLNAYANGELELYDMRLDPAQLRSLHAKPRFRPIRTWLLDRLAALAECDAAECRQEIGAEPAPLSTKQLKKLKKMKRLKKLKKSKRR